MAYINITIQLPNEVVGQCNSRVVADSTKPFDGVISLRNILDAALAGAAVADIKLAVTNVDPAVAAAGGGVSADFNLR